MLRPPGTSKGQDSWKRKREGSPLPFRVRSRQSTSSGWSNRSFSRSRKLAHKSAQGRSPSPQRGQSPQVARGGELRADPKVGKAGVRRTSRPDLVPWAQAGSQGVQAQHPLARPAPWLSSSAVLTELQHRAILCCRSDIPVAGRLAHFLPFWQEVIQADCWVLEVISQGYSIELLGTPQYQGVKSTPPPRAGPDILFDEVEDLQGRAL